MRLLGNLFTLLLMATAAGATTHNVSLSGTTFTPSLLTINSGDSVRWTNNGGFHNVVHVGQPPAFDSGDPSNANWVFIHHFTDQTAAVYPYVCEVHADMGMVGAITVLPPSAAGDAPLPTEFAVSEVYPNPFNALAHLELHLPAAANVRAEVFNSLGQSVAVLLDGFSAAGTHSIAVDGSQWTSGLYFVKVSALGRDVFKKMALLK